MKGMEAFEIFRMSPFLCKKAWKIVGNAWLQPLVAEKKPYFGGALSVKTVH